MIGLLACDHVREEFLAIGGDYDAMFQRWLPGDWRVYDVPSGERPATPQECDAWVTTGSRLSVYDDEPWIYEFASLVRDIYAAGVPFLGVCFGHQMMGHALGGRVAKSPRGWGVGVHEFQVKAREPWMNPPLDSFRLLMSCQDQVEVLPPGAVMLAGNEHCPVGMFRVRNMLGLQAHPEFSAAYAEALMRARVGLIGEQTVAAGLASLENSTHARELSEWARTFLFAR